MLAKWQLNASAISDAELVFMSPISISEITFFHMLTRAELVDQLPSFTGIISASSEVIAKVFTFGIFN